MEDRTRGHNYKLENKSARLDIRKHFFGLRVVDIWNNLPATVVNAPSLNAFKNRCDKVLSDHQCTINIDIPEIFKSLKEKKAEAESDDLKDTPQDTGESYRE